MTGCYPPPSAPNPPTDRNPNMTTPPRVVHTLKIQPGWLDRILRGDKTHEVRRHDRDYQRGDLIALDDGSDPHPPQFEITHVLPLHHVPAADPTDIWGAPTGNGYVVLSIRQVT